MNTLLLNDGNTRYRLVADENVPSDKRVVLADLTSYGGTGVWDLSDLRLKSYRVPRSSLSISADDMIAEYIAESAEELAFVRSQLKEWVPDPSNELGTRWCTYNGIVRGKRPSEMGRSSSFAHHDWPVLMKRSEGLQRMREIAKFWRDQPFSERDPDLHKKIAEVHIDNPWIQPGASVIALDWRIAQLGIKAGSVVNDASQHKTPSPR